MDFLSGSFKVGRLFDIDIRLHVLFLVFTAFWFLQNPTSDTLIWLGMLYGIVLAHEYGHCFGARAVGGDAHTIMLWPLGGIAYPWAPMRPWNQFVTVMAGPLVNVIFCVGAALSLFLAGPSSFYGYLAFGFLPIVGTEMPGYGFALLEQFYFLNLILFVFNMLPVFPLDGGQIFRAVLWRFMGLQRATVLACQVGIGGAMLFAGFGLMNGRFMLLAIAFFAGFACFQQLQAARAGMLISDERFDVRGRAYRPSRSRGGGGGGFFGRLFGGRRTSVDRTPTPPPNPNPGAWEQKQAEQQRIEAEVDRILKKVKEHGINSLSYVEQQTLKHATAARQRDDREFSRRTNL